MSDQTATVSDVSVRLDDRIRLISTILAVTDYPDKAQQVKPHGSHAHARATRKYLTDHSKDYAKHPAVTALQALLDRGTPIEALFSSSLLLNPKTFLAQAPLPDWLPADWDKLVANFYKTAQIEEWWEKEKYVWDKAFQESSRVFAKVTYKNFLRPYFGEIKDTLVFIPNVSYPSGLEVGIRFNNELICITPPPLAWGDSPPWPYDEDTMLMHSFRCSLVQYGRILLNSYLRSNPDKVASASETPLPVNDQFRAQFPTWEEQFSELFVTALVAMYLEEFLSEAEYKAYVLIERKVRGMNILPGTVSVIRRFLQERGNKYETLLDFLPLFPKQLRVAKRIVTL